MDNPAGSGAALTKHQWAFQDLRSRCRGSGFDIDITLTACTRLSEKITLSVKGGAKMYRCGGVNPYFNE